MIPYLENGKQKSAAIAKNSVIPNKQSQNVVLKRIFV